MKTKITLGKPVNRKVRVYLHDYVVGSSMGSVNTTVVRSVDDSVWRPVTNSVWSSIKGSVNESIKNRL
jgi:hypothetical protein